jgi:hypothetical protein
VITSKLSENIGQVNSEKSETPLWQEKPGETSDKLEGEFMEFNI